MKWITQCCFEENLGEKKVAYCLCEPERFLLKLFWNDVSFWGRQTNCKVSFHSVTVFLAFYFANNAICACHEGTFTWVCCLLESVTHLSTYCFKLPWKIKKQGNSHYCPCEEMSRRKHRYRQNSKVIHSVSSIWASIICCWVTVLHSRKYVQLWKF